MNLKTYLSKKRGTAALLAESLGVSRSYLSQMASSRVPISPSRAVDIEKATHGVVRRQDLRPADWAEIWPELDRQSVIKVCPPVAMLPP